MYFFAHDYHSAVEWRRRFGNSKKAYFQFFNFFLLQLEVYIINFDNSTQKSICNHLLLLFSTLEVAPFCLFCHFLLFLCSDMIQIFNCILIGGNLWMKFHFFHVIQRQMKFPVPLFHQHLLANLTYSTKCDFKKFMQ